MFSPLPSQLSLFCALSALGRVQFDKFPSCQYWQYLLSTDFSWCSQGAILNCTPGSFTDLCSQTLDTALGRPPEALLPSSMLHAIKHCSDLDSKFLGAEILSFIPAAPIKDPTCAWRLTDQYTVSGKPRAHHSLVHNKYPETPSFAWHIFPPFRDA